jgi:ElaB/YqjD/DUF883 family membrane-anchored ribosome-binding protein
MAPYAGPGDSGGYTGSVTTDAYRVAIHEGDTGVANTYDTAAYSDTSANTDAEDADAGTEDASQIRAQIEQTRSEMSETIDAIQEKLNPDNLKEQAQDMVREATVGRAQEAVSNMGETAKGFGSNMLETIKENPLPSALAAIGIAWLFSKNANKPIERRDDYGYRYRPDYLGYETGYNASYRGNSGSGYRGGYNEQNGGGIGDKVSNVAQNAGDKVGKVAGAAGDTVGQAASTVKDTVGQVAQNAGDKVGEIGEQAQYKAGQAGDWFQRTLHENPLVIGALGVVAGAAIGLLLPETEQEHRIMGQARDNLMDKAQGVAQETVDKVQRVANQAGDAVQQAAQNEGLTQDGRHQQQATGQQGM